MISAHDHKIQELVNDIENGHLLLPEMQRGYVWKSTQVRDLFARYITATQAVNC